MMSDTKAGVRSAWASISGREIISIKVGKLVDRIASATLSPIVSGESRSKYHGEVSSLPYLSFSSQGGTQA